MWKCEKCQTISEGNFCNHCGAPRPKKQTPLVRNTKNRGLVIAIVIFAVLLVVGLFAVIGTGILRGIMEENDTSFVEPLEKEVMEEILDEFEDFSEENAVLTPAPTPTPVPQATEAPISQNAQKKAEFLERARQIESYEANAKLDTLPQMDLNRETGVIFTKWDTLLNDVYQYLKKTLPSSEFSALRKAELAWIKNKEAAIERAGKEWEGGSGEPAARNSTGISYTRARCYELIEMVD